MMQQLEVNVEINNGSKKDAKGASKTAEVAAGKFMTATKIRESFSLNFESLFLDMFTEMPVAKAPRIEEPRPVERAEAPRPVEARVEQAPRAEAPRPVEAPRVEENRSSESAVVDQRAEHAEGQELDETGQDAARAERPHAEKPHRNEESDGRERAGETTTHLRAMRIELSAKLQESLGAEKIDALKKKIEDLLEDDAMDAEALMASVLQVLGEIVGPIEAPKILEDTGEMNARDLGRLLKKVLKELASVMETGPQVETATAASAETSQAIETRVEDVFAKLLQKMDRKVTREDQEIAKNLTRPEIEMSTAREARDERPVEAPKMAPVKRETARTETPRELEARVVDENRPRRVEMGLEAAAIEASRAKARPAPIASSATPVVTGIAEAARAAKPEGGPNLFWQNSYNQSASQKGTGEAAQARRGQEAPRPQQNQIFDQIIQQAKFQLTNGKSEATIRLQPEFLGKVEMKITVEDGKVNVRFTAENSAVRTAMTENIQDLKRSLAEIGLEVEDVSVLLAGEFAGTDTRDENEGEGGENPRTFGRYVEETEDEESFEEIRSVIEDGSTVRYVA